MGSTDHRVYLWSLEPHVAVRSLGSHESTVHSVALSADGKQLASRSSGGVVLWSTASAAVTRQLPIGGNGSLAFARDGTLWAATDERFVDGASYCAAIGEAIAAAVDAAVREAAAAEITIQPPPPFDPRGASRGRTIEQLLAEHAEQSALAFDPFVEAVVVVLSIDREDARSVELAATIGRITEATESGRFKLVLLVEPGAGIVRDVEVARPRVVALRQGDAAAIGATIRHAMIEPLPRMLVYDAPRRGQAWLTSALIEAGLANRALVVHAEEVRFWRPIHFYGRVAEAVVRKVHAHAERAGRSDRTAPLLAEIAAPVGRHGAEVHFAQLLLRVQRTVLDPEQELIVVLAASIDDDVPPGEQQEFLASLGRLARALVSAKVRVCAVAPGVEHLAGTPRRAVMRTLDFRIDGPVIEKGLTDKLAQPDLPTIERLRCLSALAAYRMHNGDPERGMALQIESLELAHATEEPIEIASAWYGMGGALYHCAAFDKAMEAYARCVEVAVEHDHAVLAASGMTGIGHCDFMVGACDRAIERYTIAAKYYANMRNHLAEAYARTWIAESHAKAGRRVDAVVEFDRALACCNEVPETFGDAADSSRADILQRKARVFDKLGMGADKKRELESARRHGAIAPPSEEP